MIDRATFLYFVDRALDGMVQIVVDLGDGDANRRPAIAGANSPYVILTHCLGVMDYWAGALVAGREVHRDRDAEFTATGTVEALEAATRSARARLERDLDAADPHGELHGSPPASYRGPAEVLTQAGALQHVYEELAQHHGQMEIVRDIILAETAA